MPKAHQMVVLFLALTLAACDRDASNAANQNKSETIAGKVDTAKSNAAAPGGCDQLPNAGQLKQWLQTVPAQGEAGGFTGGRFEWAAVVNRAGELCAIAVAPDDAAAAWPGSQAIAKAKAFTANAFSSDSTPLSTARLYTMSLPGHSLWSIGNANPFNAACMSTPAKPDEGIGKVCGGIIAFGGGLPLYKGEKRVGGLGLSGDTSCADHEIAKRIRTAAKLDPAKGAAADDIVYASIDGPSIWAHPLCPNTWRNGTKVGDEPPAPTPAAAG